MSAALHVGGSVYSGILWDLSVGGGLFLPEQHVDEQPGIEGRLKIGEAGHLEPRVRIARISDVQHSNIPAVRGVGVEFPHLSHAERQAIEHLTEGKRPSGS